jgi:Uma2 family endonuclease
LQHHLCYPESMALPALKSDYKYTYGDYCSWPDEERWEIIEGEPVAMSPAPNRYHQRILWNLSGIMHRAEDTGLLKGCEVYPAPFDVRLPDSDEADDLITTVVQPDISIICDNRKLDDKGCRGAPDLIMEILSPSTASRDMILKKDLYQKHGVKEYWIVHPLEKIVIVYKLINLESSSERLFDKGSVYTEKDEVALSVPEGIVIRLSEIFGD